MSTVILNIDDDEAGRRTLSHHLKMSGFEVIEAANGAEGIRKALEEQPELILLDIRLPDVSGVEVFRQLRSEPETAETPILQLSTSYPDPEARVESSDVSADAFLTKPVEPQILLATVRSLLRLRRAEEKVRDTALEWTTAFDAIQNGVALLDLEGKVARANGRYRELSSKYKIECGFLLPRLRETGVRQSMDSVDGSVTLEIHLDPVLSGEGELRGYVCTVTDVTEKRKFDERLQHAQKLESIGVLAGGIAHDFNNLLTGILGNASLLMDELPTGTPGFEMAQEIVKASESAADLTKQLLAYAGKGRFVMQQLNLSDQIASSRSFLSRLVPHGARLVFDLADGLPPLEADVSQLQQIVMNLAINAAESFGDRGKGTVTISTAAREVVPDQGDMTPGTYVVLTVKDTGCGMTPEVRARIFDPFFTTKFTGRGLGLSAVHGILKAHHGYLELETAVGVGTTFRLFLPASASGPAPRRELETSMTRGEGTVLVIDDEAPVRNFAEAALTRLGYTVRLAENGLEGLELVRKEASGIKAVLLDFAMPVMDGEEALERIRNVAPELPVILSTGFNLNEESERLKAKGATAFLSKPYTASQLSVALDKIV